MEAARLQIAAGVGDPGLAEAGDILAGGRHSFSTAC
jgi:hypothetical protein